MVSNAMYRIVFVVLVLLALFKSWEFALLFAFFYCLGMATVLVYFKDHTGADMVEVMDELKRVKDVVDEAKKNDHH